MNKQSATKEILERLERLEQVYSKFVQDMHRRIEELRVQNLALEAQLALTTALVGRPSDAAMYDGHTGVQEFIFDLSKERVDEEIFCHGFGYAVEECNGIATIRFNRRDSEKISLRRQRALAIHFNRFYLSNPAQPGGVLKFRVFQDVRAFFHLTPQTRRSYNDYDVLVISNATPFTDVLYETWGTSLTVMQSSGSWYLKVNDKTKPALYLEKGNVLQIDFDRLYISGLGDGGSTPIKIYIGRET